MRLDAFLAEALNESRGNVKKYIRQKRVMLSGIPAISPSEKVDGKEIFFDGRKIKKRSKTYLLLNKPKGYVSTTESVPESVLSLIPSSLKTKGLAPAGRLDKESEGLLILTDDGSFIHNIISPSKHLEKVYFVVASRPFSSSDIKAFESGIVLKDGTECLPSKLEITENQNEAYITLREGKYHQIRRMVASCGNYVTRLIRIKIGPYSIEGLNSGEFREFNPFEEK